MAIPKILDYYRIAPYPTNAALSMNMSRHNANLAFLWLYYARAVWSQKARPRLRLQGSGYLIGD